MRLFLIPLLLLSHLAIAEEIVLEPVADNSIYSDLPNNTNGAHEFLYLGVTKFGGLRRALLRFDVSSIPSDATVQSAELSFYVERSQSSDRNHTVHRLTSSWGEGAANSGDPGGQGVAASDGDATWLSSAHNEVSWTTPGGDFLVDPSGQGDLGLADSTGIISGEGMVSDIQLWIENPTGNHGWVVLGDELETFNAKRVFSRESSDPRRPQLTVVYTTSSGNEPADGWVIH